MSVLSQHSFGQSCMSMSNCTTVSATLASFTSANTITITSSTNANELKDISGKLIYIPSGITFTGNINNVNASSVICIDAGASFSPGSMNNFSGTIRNYSSSITLTNLFNGNIENYNGTMTVINSNQINNGKYVLNCGGVIQWNGSININGGSVYNNGTFTIRDQVSGSSGCIFNENLMIIGSSITNTTQQGYTGNLKLNNNGLLKIPGEMQGGGTVVNQGWMTIGGYVGQNQFTNYGKVEVVGTKLYFNSSGNLNNYCTFYSNTSGAEFQNNQSINNYGLIYLPVGKWHNQNGTFFNGATGIVRTNDLLNTKTVTGSGKFYVTGKSENLNGSASFGADNGGINFYDASNSGNPGHFDSNTGGTIGSGVIYTPFPMPEYTPDLSLYQCGSIVLAGSVHPGTIAASQTLCLGVSPQGFTSTQDAWVNDGGATITYQWQSSTDGTNFTNISGATNNVFSTTRPSAKTYYRRRAKATYAGADSIKNSIYGSNIVSLTPVSTPSPSVTTNPTSSSVCENSQAQFSASGQNYNSLQWQESADNGTTWTNLQNSVPYSGTNTTSLTTNPASAAMNGRLYRLALINNNCGTAFSNPATLTIISNDAPVISAQPADQIVCIGSTSSQFSVVSSSAVSSYQWQLSTNNGTNWTNCSGANYSGETTNTLTINSGGLTNGYQFRCVLTATCNSTTSNAATLYIVTPEVRVTPVGISPKCPDTDPALEFNPLDNQYNMGNSRVTFTVQRQTAGSFAWSFNYNVTASPTLLATNQPQPITGTINVAAGTSSYDLSFYLENQTTSSTDVTMTLSNVSVAGYTESSTNNPDHAATIQVRRLPVSGQFITE